LASGGGPGGGAWPPCRLPGRGSGGASLPGGGACEPRCCCCCGPQEARADSSSASSGAPPLDCAASFVSTCVVKFESHWKSF